jgi:peptidoglycan pentaglycine glycine transferase (the first glycine)
VQIIETANKEEFNSFLISQAASILQSWQWGEFQKKLGRKIWRLFLSTNTGKPMLAATVIKMPLPRGLSYFYCPHGPVLAGSCPNPEKVWQLFLDKLSDLVIVEKPIFLRVDPMISTFPAGVRLERLGFKKITWEIQPRHTLVLDIKITEDAILHSMKPKTRYNINLAERRGVVVERLTDSRKIKVFWELMSQTTARDHFFPHPYGYYANLLETLGKEGHLEMFLASYQFRPLAAALVGYFGRGAWYLHGCSSDTLRSVMAPHLVQWSAIRSAKEHSAQFYDFHGIAPASQPKHPWAGVTRFKKGFGGREAEFVGTYDLPYNKSWYAIYRVARRLHRAL